MKKIKQFIIKYKVQILAVCAAIITLATSFMAFGGKVAIACTVIISIVELIIYYLKNGFTDVMATMLVNLIKLIVEIINNKTASSDTKISKSSNKNKVISFTDDEIRKRLFEGIK